jgi:hypothetical protein
MKKIFALAFTAIVLVATAPLASAGVTGQSVQDITGGWYGPGQSVQDITGGWYGPGQSVQDITGGWYGPNGQSVQDYTGGW